MLFANFYLIRLLVILKYFFFHVVMIYVAVFSSISNHASLKFLIQNFILHVSAWLNQII